jgi:flavodoxin
MKPNVLVAYTSKYGSTKQYAEWIAEGAGTIAKQAAEVTEADITGSDIVLCGGYLRVGKIRGREFLIRHWPALQGKKVALFTVSGAPRTSSEQKTWFEANIPAEIRAHVQHFPLQGRAMNLDLLDRTILWFPKTALRLKCFFRPTPENKAATNSFKLFDGVKREYIEPILAFVKNG